MAASHYSYSGLEVAPKSSGHSDIEVVSKHTTQPGLEYDHYKSDYNQKEAAIDTGYVTESPEARRRICGLSPKSFWVVIIILVVVIVAGAVGGGVGGSLLSKVKVIEKNPDRATIDGAINSTTSSSSINSINPSTSLTPTTTTPPPLSTTTIIGPKYTLQRDCPSSNNTLYNVALGDTDMQFRKLCGLSYLNTNGIEGVVNTKTASLNVCINLCANYNLQNATGIAAGVNSVCNAVCWRNTLDGDEWPGYCFGYTTQNSSSAFVVNKELKCDSAAWINQKFI